jgi:FkbM family methyltransferase
LGKEIAWTILTEQLDSPVIYSGGVGKNISFELECIKKLNAQVWAFDPTITGIQTIEKITMPENFHFLPVALSNEDGTIELIVPVNIDEGSYTRGIYKNGVNQTEVFPCRKISSLMLEYGHEHIDILKIDIEGAEYDVLHNILDEKLHVHQICVEFHHFFDGIPRRMTTDIIRRLRSSGYRMFHRFELDYSFYHISMLDAQKVL